MRKAGRRIRFVHTTEEAARPPGAEFEKAVATEKSAGFIVSQSCKEVTRQVR